MLDDILKAADADKASDIHINAGQQPLLRITKVIQK